MITVTLVVVIVAVFFLSTDIFRVMGTYAVLLSIIPAIWLYRFGKIARAMFGKNSKPVVRLRAAASETMLRLATPRGNSGVYWSAMGDAVIGKNLILLRENARSPNVVPLPRKALVDERQWEQLVELVRRKVCEHNEIGDHEKVGKIE